MGSQGYKRLIFKSSIRIMEMKSFITYCSTTDKNLPLELVARKDSTTIALLVKLLLNIVVPFPLLLKYNEPPCFNAWFLLNVT